LCQDQCRQRRRIIGAHTFRLLMAAARTLWVIERTAHMGPLDLRRYRPWYRKKVAPSQLDVLILCRAALQAEGVSPIIRFDHALNENRRLSENTQAKAA
jgi:hypothetical protein